LEFLADDGPVQCALSPDHIGNLRSMMVLTSNLDRNLVKNLVVALGNQTLLIVCW